jgi:hypothetical protein
LALYFLVHDETFFHSQVRPVLAASWRQRSFTPCVALCCQLLPAARVFAERFHLDDQDNLLGHVVAGLSFDRVLWRHLAGEILWFGAEDIPEIETNVEALKVLLGAPGPTGATAMQGATGGVGATGGLSASASYEVRHWQQAASGTPASASDEVHHWQQAASGTPTITAERPRSEWAPIVQAHYGSRDLTFSGGFYRPGFAGWNDLSDVHRLSRYLNEVTPTAWTAAQLAALPDLPADERDEELAFLRDWFPALQSLYRQAAQNGRIVVCEEIE